MNTKILYNLLIRKGLITKDEYQNEIKQIKNVKLEPTGQPNTYWQGDKMIVRFDVKDDELM